MFPEPLANHGRQVTEPAASVDETLEMLVCCHCFAVLPHARLLEEEQEVSFLCSLVKETELLIDDIYLSLALYGVGSFKNRLIMHLFKSILWLKIHVIS